MDKPIGGFGKHYSSMYAGSMVGSGAVVFAVMGYVIANQVPNFDGELVVELNPELLGFILGEKPKSVVEAIDFLCSPDAKSRTKVEEGRRLVKLGEFSYLVVNGRHYRAMRDPARRREQNREAKRRQRNKAKPVSAEYRARESAFEKADGDGNMEQADGIAAEGLPAGAVNGGPGTAEPDPDLTGGGASNGNG